MVVQATSATNKNTAIAFVMATPFVLWSNAAVEQAPEGHLSRTPGSPRGGAEGKLGVRSTAAFPPERSGRGND